MNSASETWRPALNIELVTFFSLVKISDSEQVPSHIIRQGVDLLEELFEV